MTAWLICAAALVYFLPEHLAQWLGHSRAAWQYVGHGVEAAILWLLVGLLVRQAAVRFVALFGFFEAVQRPVCRLAFPMTGPVPLAQGQTLCDAALGIQTLWISVSAALFGACLAQEVMREKGR